MGKKISKDIVSLLGNSYLAYLCTVNEENLPHVTPVFFIYQEKLNLIYFMSMLKTKKITHILSNNRVCLTIDIRDPTNPFNNIGVMIEGKAHLDAEIKLKDFPSNRVFLKEPALKIFAMFEKKYPVLREAEGSVVDNRRLKKFTEVLVSIKLMKLVYWGKGQKFDRITF